MKCIRLIPRLAIVVLTIAACSSDSAATTASARSGSSAPASSATTTTSQPAGKEIHATSTAGNPTIGAPFCDAEQHCMIPLSGTETYSGDMSGTSISYSAGALVGDKFAAGGTAIFTGTVADCGTGTVVVVSRGTGAVNGSGSGEWEIVEGFGTGDLASASGGGTSTYQASADGTATTVTTGHVSCQ